jgi:glycosyltransferase involved in cell wall biosynthesis
MSEQTFIPRLVSIVVPTFNRGRLLEESLRSAFGQTYPNKEIIVIDDGSTDDTSARMKNFPAAKFYTQKNTGPSPARNHGMGYACGEFIAFLDSDDIWDLNFLEESVRAMEAADAGFVFANRRGIFEDGSADYPDFFCTRRELQRFRTLKEGNWFVLSPQNARELFIFSSVAPSSGTLMRRSVINGSWDENLRVGEDRMFLLDAIFSKQCRAAFTDTVLWSHRLHSANSYVGHPNLGRMAEREISSKQAILKKYGAQLSASERKTLDRSIAENLFDWGYHESCSGHRSAALRFYSQSLARHFSEKTLVAMAKALLRPASRKNVV